MPGLECTGRVAALERAAEKLTRAAEFGAGDSAPCNALGAHHSVPSRTVTPA